MQPAFAALALQGLLGALDNLWHHELEVRLPSRPQARRELTLHALRSALYVALFLVLAWLELRGWLALTLAALLGAELLVTLLDFIEEDRTRALPASERVLHTVLAVNYGVFLALFAPTWLDWCAADTGVRIAHHAGWSQLFTLYALGAGAWAIRDALAAWRLHRPALATWQRRQIAVRTQGTPRTILVSGATGFVGRHLCWRLIERGHRVIALVRDRGRATDLFGPYAEVVTSVDHIHRTRRVEAIVNLAGEPIAAARWTPARKAVLVESRLATTRALVEWIGRHARRPAVLISASAVGWYGERAGEVLSEASDSGSDFAAALCRGWEREAEVAAAYGVRVVLLRLGVVLGPGGMLARLLPLFRLGLGAPLGGAQWMAWIHLDDVLDIVERALSDAAMHGALNATAPEPVTNTQFSGSLAAALRRPLWPVVPAALLRLMLGEMAQVLLGSQRVQPVRLNALGYRFAFPALADALRDLVPSARTHARAAAAGRSEPAARAAPLTSTGH